MQQPIILLVEDEKDLAKMVCTFLGDQGFHVEWIDEGNRALERLRRSPAPDLVLLDIMLPGLSGIDICKAARRTFSNPILMLTAKDDDLSEILSLELGADGFLNKPVRPHVLLSHIKALLRRSSKYEEEPANIVRVQDITMNKTSMAVSIEGDEIILSTAEYQLLLYLAESAGKLVSRQQLYRELRGIDFNGTDRSMDQRVSVLRKKLNDEVPPFRYIKTVRGRGYLMAL